MDWQALEEEIQDLLVSRLPAHAQEDEQSMERFHVRHTLIALHTQVEQTKQLTRIADYLETIKRLTP